MRSSNNAAAVWSMDHHCKQTQKRPLPNCITETRREECGVKTKQQCRTICSQYYIRAAALKCRAAPQLQIYSHHIMTLSESINSTVDRPILSHVWFSALSLCYTMQAVTRDPAYCPRTCPCSFATTSVTYFAAQGRAICPACPPCVQVRATRSGN